MNLDKRGIPGCAVISREFMPGAEAQSKSLGFMPAIVWTSHPIQNLTPEELTLLADNVIEEIFSKICLEKINEQ